MPFDRRYRNRVNHPSMASRATIRFHMQQDRPDRADFHCRKRRIPSRGPANWQQQAEYGRPKLAAYSCRFSIPTCLICPVRPCEHQPGCAGRHAKSARNRPLPQSVTRTTFSMDLPLSDELPSASHLLIGFNMWRRSLLNTNKLGKTMQFKYARRSTIGCICASLFQLDDVSPTFSRNNASLARYCKSHNYGNCINFQQNRAVNARIRVAEHSAASRWLIFPTKQAGAALRVHITRTREPAQRS